jgi:hypothetical protein
MLRKSWGQVGGLRRKQLMMDDCCSILSVMYGWVTAALLDAWFRTRAAVAVLVSRVPACFSLPCNKRAAAGVAALHSMLEAVQHVGSCCADMGF